MGRAEMFFEASRALSNTSGGKIYENVCRTHSLACQNHLQASRKIRFARINADRQSFDPECSWNQLHMDTSSYWKQVCTIVLPYTLCVYVMDEIQTYTLSIFSLKCIRVCNTCTEYLTVCEWLTIYGINWQDGIRNWFLRRTIVVLVVTYSVAMRTFQ